MALSNPSIPGATRLCLRSNTRRVMYSLGMFGRHLENTFFNPMSSLPDRGLPSLMT